MFKLLKNSLIYSIGNILPQIIGFLLLPIYTKYLSPKDYGIIASMGVLTAVLTIIFTLSTDRSIYRLYYDYKNTNLTKTFLGTICIFITAVALASMIIIFIFRRNITNLYIDVAFYPYYVFAILSCFFGIFSTIPKIYLQIREKAKEFVILSLGQFILATILILWFVCIEKSGAEGQLKGQLLANVIFMPIYLFILSRIIKFRFDLEILVKVLSFSIPFVPTLLFAWIINLSNRIFLVKMSTLSVVGIYSLGCQLGAVILIVINGFHTAYSPYFFSLANEDEDEKNKINLNKLTNMAALGYMLFIFIIALISKELVMFFMNPRYIEAYSIMRIILPSYLFAGMAGIASLSIMQHKKTKAVMAFNLAAALINIALNYILIGYYGMYGAAFATLLSEVILFYMLYSYSKRCYFIPIDWERMMPYAIMFTSIIIFYQFILEKYAYASIITKIIIFGLVAISIAMKAAKEGYIKQIFERTV